MHLYLADYNIFMAMADKIGHDKRGNPIFRRNKDGNEILVPDNDNVLILGDTAEGDRTVSLQQKKKLQDDQTSEIPEIFAEWKKSRDAYFSEANNYMNWIRQTKNIYHMHILVIELRSN